MKILENITPLLTILGILLFFIVAGYDMYKQAQITKYTICDGDGCYHVDKYYENNDCIYFKDINNDEISICHSYSISSYK